MFISVCEISLQDFFSSAHMCIPTRKLSPQLVIILLLSMLTLSPYLLFLCGFLVFKSFSLFQVSSWSSAPFAARPLRKSRRFTGSDSDLFNSQRWASIFPPLPDCWQPTCTPLDYCKNALGILTFQKSTSITLWSPLWTEITRPCDVLSLPYIQRSPHYHQKLWKEKSKKQRSQQQSWYWSPLVRAI